MATADIVKLFKRAPNYVPPISLVEVGKRAYGEGLSPEAHWPQAMRVGWIRANNVAADAQTSAYLVATRQAV